MPVPIETEWAVETCYRSGWHQLFKSRPTLQQAERDLENSKKWMPKQEHRIVKTETSTKVERTIIDI